MGVGEPVMTLMRKTPAASIRWLSLADLRASHLATMALDAADPILTSGLNGLNGRAFDGDPPRADLVRATMAKPVGPGATLEIALRYRRGGGVVEAEATERGLAAPQAVDPQSPDLSLTLSAASGEPLQLQTAGTTPQRALIARERFCTLAHSGAIIAASARDGPQGSLPAFELAAMDGAKTLLAEACP
jgi:hypothetical protein